MICTGALLRIRDTTSINFCFTNNILVQILHYFIHALYGFSPGAISSPSKSNKDLRVVINKPPFYSRCQIRWSLTYPLGSQPYRSLAFDHLHVKSWRYWVYVFWRDRTTKLTLFLWKCGLSRIALNLITRPAVWFSKLIPPGFSSSTSQRAPILKFSEMRKSDCS